MVSSRVKECQTHKWLKRMCFDILKWNEAQSFCVLRVHRDGGLKRGKVKEVFKEEQQKLYSKVLVGSSEDRSRSWRDAAVCLTLHMLLGAHGKSLDHQRMRCGPRLAPSWTCSDWIVELKWSHCELVGNFVARPSAHCCASGAFASLHESVCGIQFLGWLWFQFGVLNICAVTIMHDVPGEEWVEEFEVIYLSL